VELLLSSARGGLSCLGARPAPADREADGAPPVLGTRPALQSALKELGGWINGSVTVRPDASRDTNRILDIQETIGLDVVD
jgi:hypothetical protein